MEKNQNSRPLLKVSRQGVQINYIPDPGDDMFLHTTVCSVTSPISGVIALLRATYLMGKQQLMIIKHNFGHNMLFYQSMELVLLKCHHSPLSFSLKKRDSLQHSQLPAQLNLGRKTQWRSKGARKHFLKQLPAHNALAYSTAQQYSTFHLHQAGDPDT